jgi:hypothetical protein
MLQLLLRFCVLGSAVGGGAFVVTRDFLQSNQPVELGRAALALVLGVPFWATLTAFLSVPLGFIPAAIACLGYWVVLNRFTVKNPNGFARAAIGAAAGAAAATIFGGTLFSVGTGPGGYSIAVNTWSWFFAGLLGGAISALSVRNETYKVIFTNRSVASGA